MKQLKLGVLRAAFITACFVVCGFSQTVQISDTLYGANGLPVNGGRIIVSWTEFTAADLTTIAAGNVQVAVSNTGVVNFSLYANVGASPAGTSYQARYILNNGTQRTEVWVVPSPGPVTISAIRASTVPAPTTIFNPLTQLYNSTVVQGDLLIGSSTAGYFVRLPIGSNGLCLTSNGTTAAWGSCAAGGSGHTIQDEGSSLTSRTNLNFTGAGITCTDDAGNNQTDCDVPGSGGSGHTIEEEGAPLTSRTGLNFVGPAITATDDAGNDETDVTVVIDDSTVPDTITLTNITQITNRAIGDTTGDLAAARVDDGGAAATQALFSGAGGAAGFRGIADGDVPNNITIDLATTATTANAGDSATAFFSSGTLEVAIGGTGSTPDGDDQALVSTSTTGADWETLPNGAVAYATATNSFSQAACANLSDAGTLCTSSTNFEEEAQLGTTNVSDNVADDQILRGTAANAADWVTLANGAVSYNSTTNAFAQAACADLSDAGSLCASSTDFEEESQLGSTSISDNPAGSGELLIATGSNAASWTPQNAGTNVTSDLEEEGQINTTAVTGNAADDQVILGSGVSAAAYATIPNCLSNNMLTYDQSSNTFGCDADDGAGGGAPVGVQYVVGASDATLTAEKILTDGVGIDTVIAGGDAGTATISLDFADAGADPVLGAGGAKFSNEGASAAGLVFEGDTNDTIETRFRVTDPTSADRIVTIPDADSTTVQPDAGAANNFLTAISTSGVISKAQPAFSNLSGTAADGQIDGSLESNEVDHDATVNFVADEHVAHSGVALTAGAGLSGGGDITASRSFATASQETGFVADGGVTSLTCGAGTAGQMQVMDDGTVEWCDGAATPVLQTSALGDGAGAALSGDTATAFFAAGTIEATRLPNLESLNGTLDVPSGGTGVAPGADDQALISDSTSAATWRALPTGAVSYAPGSNTFAQAACADLSNESALCASDDIDSVTGQANWGTAATKETNDLIINGVEVDYEAGAAEGFPRLAQSATPPATACDAAGEAGRLYFDTDADTDGSVFVCLGTGGWKEIDDDGGAGGFTSFNIDGDDNDPQTITDGNEALFAGGAGIVTAASATDTITISTASSEEGFLSSGALTCGASTAGKAQVHTTPLQYCDNAGTPALQYAAYGASDGDALAGDSITGFFPAFTTSALATELSDEDYEPGDEVSTEGALELQDLQGAVTDGQVPDLDTLSEGFTAGSVIFSNGTNLSQDNTNFFWDDAANRLGILTATPDYPLEVEYTSTSTANANDIASRGFLTANPGAESATRFRGVEGRCTSASGNAQNFTDSTSGCSGVGGFGLHGGTGTITTLSGGSFQIANGAAGTVTNGAGITILGPLNTGGGTITNPIGVNIGAIAVGTNRFGLLIGDVSGGTVSRAIQTGAGDIRFGSLASVGFVKSDADGDLSVSATVGDAEIAAGAVDGGSGGEIADGSVDSNDLATANKTITKSINIFDPTTSDTNKIQWYWPAAITLQRVVCSTDTGTVTIQLDERAEATPNTAGTNSLTSSLVCDTTSEATTSFSDSGIAIDVPHNLQITATSGTPTIVRIHVKAQVN